MTGWGEFAAAFGVFFLSHSLPVRPPVKARIVARIGRAGFGLAYSALSVAVLAWLIVAAGRAPYVELWARAGWQDWVPVAAMLPACAIAALAAGRPNPLSFGGARNEAFDPAHAGMAGWVRHPLLATLLIWSLAHLVPNGDLAHVILFGAFAVFSTLGMRMIDRRRKREMGAAEWARLAGVRREITASRGGFVRVAIGVVVWALLWVLHVPVFGVGPVL